MGRYYSGDIEGKFMFAVQSSNAADRFGGESSSNFINYFFDGEHIDTIKEQLSLLEEDYKIVGKFLKNKNGYTTEQLEKADINKQQLSNYADYILGDKILKCIEENGECYFDAEM
jgi:hypothetical protein